MQSIKGSMTEKKIITPHYTIRFRKPCSSYFCIGVKVASNWLQVDFEILLRRDVSDGHIYRQLAPYGIYGTDKDLVALVRLLIHRSSAS